MYYEKHPSSDNGFIFMMPNMHIDFTWPLHIHKNYEFIFVYSFGNGYYYFSAPGRDDEGQFTRLYLYRATSDPKDPFVKVE